jgi:hypothetical protein
MFCEVVSTVLENTSVWIAGISATNFFDQGLFGRPVRSRKEKERRTRGAL